MQENMGLPSFPTQGQGGKTQGYKSILNANQSGRSQGNNYQQKVEESPKLDPEAMLLSIKTMCHQLNAKTLIKDREYKNVKSRVQEIDARTKMMEAIMRNIEVQTGHLQKAIMERLVTPRPSFTENNPRERVHAFTLISGKPLDNPTFK